MTWSNIAVIASNKNWQLSPQFTGEVIRLRHFVSGDFPYGAKGLIAQNFNDNANLELYNARSIFPFYGNDIISVLNPFKGEQRIAIRGQTKYETLISWIIYIDVWTGELDSIDTRLMGLSAKIDLNYQELIDVRSMLDLLLDKFSLSYPPNTPTLIEQTFFFLN